MLGSLVDKSLVVAGGPTELGRRFRLLEPVRQYASGLLQADGAGDDIRARHAAYYASLVERAGPLLRGPEQVSWLDRLETERENVRLALARLVAERGQSEVGLRVAVALTPYWEARGYLTEGRGWLETFITAARGGGAVRPVGDTATPAGDGGASPLIARALVAVGLLAFWQVDHQRAGAALAEAVTIAREIADRRCEAEALACLSAVHWQQHDAERGLELGESSLGIARELGDERLIAFALLNVGIALHHLHASSRGTVPLDDCLRRYRALGDQRYIAIAATCLAWVTLGAGDHERAALILRESMLGLRTVGDQRFIIIALRCLVQIAGARGEGQRAVRLLGASDALRTTLGLRRVPHAQAHDQKLLAAVGEHLTAAEIESAYAEGQTLSLDAAFADALAAR
jgi:Arc/MetJ family transcription regulator